MTGTPAVYRTAIGPVYGSKEKGTGGRASSWRGHNSRGSAGGGGGKNVQLFMIVGGGMF